MSTPLIPIVLSHSFIEDQWMPYHPQTVAEAIETTEAKQFVSGTQIASWDAAEANAIAFAKSEVAKEVAALVGSAPEALDTLAEIATALEASDGAHAAILQAIGEKAATTYVDAQLLLKADAAATTARFVTVEGSVTTLTETVGTLETAIADKVGADQLPTTTMGETAPVNAPSGSIFLKIVTPGAGA